MLPKTGNYNVSNKFWKDTNSVNNGLSTLTELTRGKAKKDK